MARRQRHLLHVFPSFGIGGVPVRVTRIINHFADRYRHTIVALDGVEAARERLLPGLPVVFLPCAIDKRRPLKALLGYRAVLRTVRPDLLVTYNWGAIDWAMANRLLPICPHLHQEDGFGIEEAAGQLPRRVLYRRLALGGTRRIVVPSRLLERIARTAWRIGEDRLRYVANGIDIARFAGAVPPADLAALVRRPDTLVVGTVAPLRPEKTLHHLLRAFASVATTVPARLVIAGEGSERRRLEALGAELGLADRLLFLGNVDAPETVLKLFDLFAISSETEQMPTTVIEAMAASLPIVGFDVGDIRDMVSEMNRAAIVHAGDIAALAAALGGLLQEPERRAAIALRNSAEAEARFAQEQMFAAYDALYSE